MPASPDALGGGHLSVWRLDVGLDAREQAEADAFNALLAAALDPLQAAAAEQAVERAVRHGIRLWDLGRDTGRSGLELAMMIADHRVRRRALEIELDAAENYLQRVRDAVRGEDLDAQRRRRANGS